MVKIYAALLFLLLVGLTSCSYLRKSCGQNAQISVINADLPVILNDSVTHIINEADEVRVYATYAFIEAHDSLTVCDTLLNYKIKESVGQLQNREREILKFVITDSNWITDKYAPVKQQFYPDIIIEFISKQAKAYLLLSFGSEEVWACDTSGEMKSYRMVSKRNLARWASLIFPDEEYYKKLINPDL